MSNIFVGTILLLATLTPASWAAIEPLADSDIMFILQKHNDYRAEEPATSMPDLVSSRPIVPKQNITGIFESSRLKVPKQNITGILVSSRLIVQQNIIWILVHSSL